MNRSIGSSDSITRPLLQPCLTCRTTTSTYCGECRSALIEIDQPDQIAYYCCDRCQAQGWTLHEDDCRRAEHRRLLFRAAFLLQGLFYVTRHAAFDVAIKSVEVEKDSSGRLIITVVPADGVQPSFSIPDETFSDDGDANLFALLTWQWGAVVVRRFHSLLESCIEGIQSEFCEAIISVAEENQRILFRDGISEELHTRHTAFGVRLRGDSFAYIIDPAGAQFQQEKAIIEWDVYKTGYGARILQTKASGWHAQQRRARDQRRYAKLRRGKEVEQTTEELVEYSRAM